MKEISNTMSNKWEINRGVFTTFSDIYRSSHPEVFCKKLFLKMLQNSQENTCAEVTS